MLRLLLQREGTRVGRRRIATVMKRMGIQALYRRPNTSKPSWTQNLIVSAARGEDRTAEPGLGDGPTYIPMARGFCYLVAVIDWFTRKVLAWRLSITMDAAFCIEALEEALAETRQARHLQFRSGQPVHQPGFHQVLLDREIKISMDGKGAWRDNVFVERLWRSVKYEEVYLRAYDTVPHARASIARYLAFL